MTRTAGSLRRSDSIRNSVSARPKIPNYGSAKIPNRASTAFGRPRMTEATKVELRVQTGEASSRLSRRERNFWMRRQDAQNHH
jgi:hypothetical protein